MRWTRATVTLGLTVAAGTLVAQEGGQVLTGLFSQSVEYDSNFGLDPTTEGNSFRTVSTLGIDYRTETRTQVLTFGAETRVFVLRDDSGDVDADIAPPSATLGYTLTAARSSLSLGARYSDIPLSFLRVGEGSFDEDGRFEPADTSETTGDTGSRRDFGASARLRLGLGGPFETEFGATGDFVRYDGAQANRIDSERFSLSAGSRLELSRVLTGTLSLTADRSRDDDAEETVQDRLTLRLGSEYAIGETLTTRAGLSYAWIDTEESGITTSAEGFGASVGFALTRPTGLLDAGLSLDRSPEGDLVTTGGLSYTQDFARAALRLGLDRSLTRSEAGVDEATTSGRVDLSRELTATSRASIGAAYTLSQPLDDGAASDTTRLTLSAGFTRDLGADASLDLGYAYRRLDEGDLPSVDSHSLSLGVSIPFNF